MPRCRCNVCGNLATTRYACKVCSSDLHHAHGHDKKHFEEIVHVWRFGGAHHDDVYDYSKPHPPHSDAPICELVHRHPYTDPDHVHAEEELPTNGA